MAASISASNDRLRDERKLLTALILDVEGSMDLAEALSADGYAQVIDEMVARVRETIERFGGTMDRFTGDGALVLFGAPRAAEDHARRACLAALELRGALERLGDSIAERHDARLRVRIGLNSGEVVFGRLRGSSLTEVFGHTVGLAQRMESLAPPGGVYLTERTAELIGGQFELRDLGPVQVKGSRHPIEVFELLGLGRERTRLDTSRGRGLSSFVGRARELGELQAELERALAGDGRVIGVVGDPGVGKSRLCHEFLELCRRQGLSVRHSSVTALGRMHPLGPVLEMLRARFDVEPFQPVQEAREQVRATLAALDERLLDGAPLMCEFLGLVGEDAGAAPTDPDTRRRRLIELIGGMVHARSAQEAAVELIEDAHWMDDASWPFLGGLIDAVAGTRTLLMVTSRSGHSDRWLERGHCRRLALAPLDHVASERLVHELVGGDASAGALADLLHDRGEGNPFFVEEPVRNLVEVGTLAGDPGTYRQVAQAPTTLPPSVEAVLAARIDRLPDIEKHVLQTASVVGREFDVNVLAGLADTDETHLDRALQGLSSAALVDRLDAGRYGFRHALTVRWPMPRSSAPTACRCTLASPRRSSPATPEFPTNGRHSWPIIWRRPAI